MKAELKTLYAKDDKQKQNLEKLDNLLAKNPQLVESLAKPRKISYELTIDKKSLSITNLKTDFSNNIQEFGNEVLDFHQAYLILISIQLLYLSIYSWCHRNLYSYNN